MQNVKVNRANGMVVFNPEIKQIADYKEM